MIFTTEDTASRLASWTKTSCRDIAVLRNTFTGLLSVSFHLMLLMGIRKQLKSRALVPVQTLLLGDLQCSPSRSILTPHMLPLKTTVPGTHSLGSIMTVVYVGMFWVYLLAFSMNQGSGVYYLFDIVSICVNVALTNALCSCV